MIDSHCHLDHEPMYSDLKNVIKRPQYYIRGERIGTKQNYSSFYSQDYRLPAALVHATLKINKH